jgi:hypothetical protein|tara:strand:- start:74 stop:208 length:135 start_codon:yes stop_codon:yes gene_type:complete
MVINLSGPIIVGEDWSTGCLQLVNRLWKMGVAHPRIDHRCEEPQ